jgi:hypothetical protein
MPGAVKWRGMERGAESATRAAWSDAMRRLNGKVPCWEGSALMSSATAGAAFDYLIVASNSGFR